jgi:hypothetical protein
MMPKTKLNPVSKRLPGNLGRVQIMLKEVLQRISSELADQLMECIEQGGTMHLSIRESPSGRSYKCDFSAEAVPPEQTPTMKPGTLQFPSPPGSA